MKTVLLFFMLGYQILCVINPPLPPKPRIQFKAGSTKGNPTISLDASNKKGMTWDVGAWPV